MKIFDVSKANLQFPSLEEFSEAIADLEGEEEDIATMVAEGILPWVTRHMFMQPHIIQE